MEPPSIAGSSSSRVFRVMGQKKRTNIKQRKKSLPEEWWWEIEGKATLCFSHDWSSFQGNLVNESTDDLFGIEGNTKRASVSNENLTIEINLVDYESANLYHLSNINLKIKEHGCEMDSENVHFKTETCLTREQADIFIKRNFSHDMMGQNRLIHIGDMHLSIKKKKAEELCYCPTQYIL